MIHRFPAILRLFLFLLSSALWLTALCIPLSIPTRIVAALFWVGSIIFYAVNRRCPFCRRFGLDNRPFSKNAGYCSHCGKLIEYIN